METQCTDNISRFLKIRQECKFLCELSQFEVLIFQNPILKVKLYADQEQVFEPDALPVTAVYDF